MAYSTIAVAYSAISATASWVKSWLSSSRRKVLVSKCLCVLFLFLWIQHKAYLKLKTNCSDAETLRAVQEVCDLYHARKISGQLCSSLCDHNHFTYSHCGNDIFSEKSVLIMNCNGCELGERVEKVVIKIGVDRANWQKTTDEILCTPGSLRVQMETLKNLLNSQLLLHTGTSRFAGSIPLTMVLGKDFYRYVNDSSSAMSSSESSRAAIRTAVALALQNEYIKILALKEYDIAPDIYGFCGPAYFLEHTTPIALLGYTLPFRAIVSEILKYRFRTKPWSDRARIALDLMQTIRKVDTDMLEICDVQERNAGISSNNRLVFFDLDYTKYGLETKNAPCELHINCDKGSCLGYCNTTNQMCTGERINNNLQTVCDLLFYGYRGISGILRFPPMSVRAELNTVLHRCVHPGEYYKHSDIYKAGTDIADQLEDVLKRSLDT